MKIGVLGGTFNPIHIGHLILADEIREAAVLDRVLFIPAYFPPHKKASDVVSGEHRLRMVELAIAGNPFFEASDIELRRKGVSYTIETITGLRRERPDGEFYFIIGADTVPELATWHKIGELAGLCKFLVGSRPGCRLRWEPLQEVLPKAGVNELRGGVIPTTPVGVSSSMIRSRIRDGRTVRYLVPRGIEKYIAEHSLYREATAT